MQNIEILKQALPYIKRYRERIFVVKMGGELVEERDVLDSICSDLSVLHEVGIRLVIIHGGGPQLSKLSEQLGVESEKVNGRRVTDDRTLELAKMVFSGISNDLLAGLRRHGVPGVGLSGVDGDLVVAKRRPPKTMVDHSTGEERQVDFQNVGDIEGVDPTVLRVLYEKRFVPVVASLGADEEGRLLNINADTIAAEVAACLPAEKLFLLTNIAGILRDFPDPASRISYLTVAGARELVESGKIAGGMAPKLEAALRAVEGGVRRAHIVNGRAPNSLLYEVFTVKGDGTMVLSEAEEASYLAERG